MSEESAEDKASPKGGSARLPKLLTAVAAVIAATSGFYSVVVHTENTDLKERLSRERITIAATEIDAKDAPSVDDCMNSVRTVMARHNGKFIEDGDNWIDFEIGDTPVTVQCAPIKGPVVIVAGRNDEDFKLAESLRDEVFPQ